MILDLFKQRNWWKGLFLVLGVGLAGVVYMGAKTYQDAPPIPDFVGPDGVVVASAEQVLDGQQVFMRHGLMTYGSMFGDGASRGPDFTADALHHAALAMAEHRRASLPAGQGEVAALAQLGVEEQVRRELAANTYERESNRVRLTAAQAYAFQALEARYTMMFAGSGPESMRPNGIITDPAALRDLTAFFYWGAWVCSTTRPGQASSYTHDWPYDPLAGNTPSPSIVFWSVFAVLALIVVLGVVLYYHGRFEDQAGLTPPADAPLFRADAVDGFRPSPSQRATYKFFAAAAALFLLQVLAGVLTVHDFVGFTTFLGVDISRALPITVVRSWHLQLALFWITACWMGASIFVLPFLARAEPPGQRRLVNLLFGLVVLTVLGSLVGIFLGPHGLLGDWWRALGHQGWEFVELGKVWQALLLGCLALWAAIVYRGVRPWMQTKQPWTLPNMLLCAVVAINGLFLAGFVAGPRTNFVIADFWRWCVIHMWAEAFFEVFTTIVVAFFMVLMGLASRAGAARVVYIATLLFLGSGLLGISHNFYWNAKPVATLALGSVFSTLQVVPLILLALEAWKHRSLPGEALKRAGEPRTRLELFGHAEAFAFVLAVSFWNFLGAGVFGFIINLPIVNYYEHGTYLTVNHGHAALMGVYGNLSLAGMIFVARLLVDPARWNAALFRVAFWALNLGLGLMVALDLFPAGVLQLEAALDQGLWHARSHAFVASDAFQTLTWLRIVGGSMFTLGGVVPIAWFMLSRLRDLKPVAAVAPEAEVPAPALARPALAAASAAGPALAEHMALVPDNGNGHLHILSAAEPAAEEDPAPVPEAGLA